MLCVLQTRSLICYAVFNQTGPLRRVYCLAALWDIGLKCLSQGHNDIFPRSGTKPKVDNPAFANFRSYPLICIAASLDNSNTCLPQGRNSALCPVSASN